MKRGVTIDVSQFQHLLDRCRDAINTSAHEAVQRVAADLHDETIKSVRGIQYKPGELPVTYVSGNLHDSIQDKEVTPVHHTILQDEQIAEYGKWVHDGTKRGLLPRRYLGDPLEKMRKRI